MRKPTTIHQLKMAAASLDAAHKAVAAAVALMESKEMPAILAHSTNQLDRRIPEIVDWAFKTKGEAESQSVAFAAGKKSKAQFEIEKNQRQSQKK